MSHGRNSRKTRVTTGKETMTIQGLLRLTHTRTLAYLTRASTLLLRRLTSVHAMRRAMNIQQPRSPSTADAFGTPIAKAILMPISLTKSAMVQRPRGWHTILRQVRDPLGLSTRSTSLKLSARTRNARAMGKATRLPKSLSSNSSLMFDTTEAEIECMSIILAKSALEFWFGNLSPEYGSSTIAM